MNYFMVLLRKGTCRDELMKHMKHNHELLEAEAGLICWIFLQIGMYLVMFAFPS